MSDANHTIAVNSLLYYTSVLVQRVAPRAGLARLGAWWGFWLPDRGYDPWESSLPDDPVGLISSLESRTGIRIHTRSGFDALRAAALRGPAICGVDSFHLPYRPAYGRVHSHRTVLLEQGEPERAWVVDDWPPRYRGWLSWNALRAACETQVPLVLDQEPVFAGGDLRSQWWTVEAEPLAPPDVRDWAGRLLRAVCDDYEGSAKGAIPAMRAMGSFARRTADHTTPADRRHQALTLRANVGPRCFFVRLLHAATGWTDTPELAGCASALADGVAQLKLCCDLLIKLTRFEHVAYVGLLEAALHRATSAEVSAHRRLTGIITRK